MLSRCLNACEYCSNHTRYNTLHFKVLNVWALHCMSFSRRSLPICKYCAIETVKYTINNRFGSNIIDFFLCRVGIKIAVKCKLLGRKCPCIFWCQIQRDVSLVRIEAKANLRAHLYLFLIQRSNTSHHNDVASLNLHCLARIRQVRWFAIGACRRVLRVSVWACLKIHSI